MMVFRGVLKIHHAKWRMPWFNSTLHNTAPCITLNGMKSTLNQQRNTSETTMTRIEFNRRLKEARAQHRELKAAGKPLPNPTKGWSKDSLKSLTAALSGR